MRETARQRSGGFSLLELVVVTTLVGILTWVSATAWGPLHDTLFALRDRSRHVAELRLALDYLLEDLGGADIVVPEGEDGLSIQREEDVAALEGFEGGSDDPGIRYRLVGRELLRLDVGRDLEIIVATGVTALEVERVDEAETHIRVAAGAGLDERAYTLVWPR